MRRNSRPMGRRQSTSRDSGGPLNINHLKDIDLELELLKRKREMIEQQQLLLIDQELAATRQFSYNNYSNNDYNRRYDDDFSNDFSNNRFSDDNEFSGYRNQFGRKRQADPQWKNDYKKQPKKGRGSFTNHGNRSGPPPGNSGSGFAGAPRYPKPGSSQYKGPKTSFSNAPTFTSNKNNKPNKTNKPKSSPMSNKSTSKSFEGHPKPKQSYEAVDANILLPDREPSLQVAGRLELALGAIMKDVRLKYGLRSLQVQRFMKQTVRERIRSVMLGKVVGNMGEILAHYREEFPPESDIDILNMAQDAIGEQREQRTVVVSDKPDDFFKRRMTNLLDKTLKEMLNDIEELYNKKNAEATTVDENVSSEHTEEGKEPNQETQEQKEVKGEAESKADSDEKALLSPTEGEQPANGEQQVATEETPSKNEGPTSIDENKPLEKTEKKSTDNPTEKELEELYKAINPGIKRIMPRIVKNYVPYIIKLMNLDSMYKKSKAQIIKQTNEIIAEQQNSKKENKQASNEDVTPATNTPAKPLSAYNLPYYVKIMGRPMLPKRKVMQQFLDKYNPKSIKRHRAIHNLLFIGFTDKQDYDNIIAADGTKLGRINLSIRTCDKQAQSEQKTEDANSSTEVSEANKSMEINSDLDQQIDDLFQAIRKEEENSFAINDDDVDMDSAANGEKDEQKSENVTSENNEGNSEDVIEIKDGETETETLQNNGDEKGQETVDVDESEANVNDVEIVEDTQPEPVQEPKNNINANANQENDTTPKDTTTQEAITEESSDKVTELKSVKVTAPATPTRSSSRLASTPSSIRTRRASKLAQE